MKFSKKLFLTFFLTLTLFQFSFAQNTEAQNNLNICKALNSINVYTTSNIQTFQDYLKKYFPNLKVTGKNDNQNKYYIGKYQIAFGLKATGQLNSETLKLLKTQNNCFDLGEKVLLIERSTPVILIDQASLIYNLITNYVYGASDIKVTSAEVTVTSIFNNQTEPQITKIQNVNIIPTSSQIINQEINTDLNDLPEEITDPEIGDVIDIEL